MASVAASHTATRRRRSASRARSGRRASTASMADVSSGSQASSAYAPRSSSTSASESSGLVLTTHLLRLRVRRRCGAARAAAVTSRCPRGSRGSARPGGRSDRRSMQGAPRAAVRSGSTSSAARTFSAASRAVANLLDVGSETARAPSRSARRRRASSRRTWSTARRCGERAEPGAQAATCGIERRRPLPEGDEDVLAHVLGRTGVADDAQPRVRRRTTRTGRTPRGARRRHPRRRGRARRAPTQLAGTVRSTAFAVTVTPIVDPFAAASEADHRGPLPARADHVKRGRTIPAPSTA